MNPIIPLNLIRNKKINFLFFFFFILSQAFAQEVYDLSRCIKLGMEQNFSLQVVRNNEKIAVNNYNVGNAGMLPDLSATGQFGGTLNSTNQSLRDSSDISANNIHNTTGSAGIDLGITIFKGFQVINTYKKLGKQSELAGLNKQMAIENLIAQIVSEYNNYIQQLILSKNLAYAVSLSRERVRIDEQRYLLGGASKMELLQSLVYLNADSSRYAQQNEVLRSSQIKLHELMSSEDPAVNIILKDTLIQINENLSYEELLSNTLASNTSLQIASKNQSISELDYKIIKSRYYPYLNLSTGYGYAYNAYGSGDIRHQQIYGMNYGLTLGINIFDGFNRRREIKNARVEIENKNFQYKEIEQEVKADLLSIFFAYENNIRLIRLEEQNLEIAHENLKIAIERYKLGNLSGIELREVQKSLLDAEERLISVKYMAKLAEISLKLISGKIMDYL